MIYLCESASAGAAAAITNKRPAVNTAKFDDNKDVYRRHVFFVLLFRKEKPNVKLEQSVEDRRCSLDCVN